MTFLINLLIFLFIFSGLVLIHEWGHFVMARRAGIKVEEFGIGLPPRAKAIYKDKKGTVYSINWIPFGGYVRLYGEDSSDKKILKASNSFASKTKLERTGVIVAGVVMNFVLAWALLTIGYSIGMKPMTAEVPIEAQINEIMEDSTLIGSKLEVGDSIIAINGQELTSSNGLSDVLEPNQTVQVEVSRAGETLILDAQTNAEGAFGVSISNNPLEEIEEVKLPIHTAAWESGKEVGKLSYLTVAMLGDVVTNVFTKFNVPEGVAGPVGIFKMTEQAKERGFIDLLQLMAILSISLGVINIMPFPALDGGRFLFIIFETILGKKPNAKWEAIIHGIGFILLISLILLITWKDIFG